MAEISKSPEWDRWDRDNQRFTTPSRCPYPDCGEPVDPIHAIEPTLGWCAACSRPYEIAPFRPTEDAAPIELNRRPASAHCTYSGQLLTAHSVVDWGEAGGEPGRSYCLEDARGAVFGTPSTRRILRIKEDWNQPSILSSRGDDDDFVSSVSVVRGKVVVVTARGWVGLFDATSGDPARGPGREDQPVRPLAWPTGSTDPMDPLRAVRQPPAFRGTQMVLAAPHEAQFRELKTVLFPGRGTAARGHRMVAPEAGLHFLGPPLGIDGLTSPVFCLLEGREETKTIEEAKLRFFNETGQEIGRCPAPGIARPPVFDRHLGRIIWVDQQGALSTFANREIGRQGALPETTGFPDPILAVEANLRPTFAVARNAQGRSEVWLSTTRPDGGVDFHRTVLDEAPARRSAVFGWQTQSLPGIGQVMGFAVGIGSSHRNNAAGQLVAVATDRQVLTLDRSNLAGVLRVPMEGPEALGVRGSYDVPIICSAGVIARLQGSVSIDFQGLGWSDETFQPKAAVPGLYQSAQGMAMFGRRIYVGHGLGVRSHLVLVEEIP
jgi:hypothetical protein